MVIEQKAKKLNLTLSDMNTKNITVTVTMEDISEKEKLIEEAFDTFSNQLRLIFISQADSQSA